MPTETLVPGAVTLGSFTPTNDPPHWPETVVVGSTPQWADSDDGSYATVVTANDDVPVYGDIATAPLPAITFDPETCTNIVATLRCKIADPGTGIDPVLAAIQIRDIDDPGVFSVIASWDGVSTPALVFDTIVDLTYDYQTFADDIPDLPDAIRAVAALFAVPRAVVFGSATTAGGGVKYISTAYEMALTFTFADGTVVPVVRQFPRDDALGFGSVPRIHPPSRAGRFAGGFQ